MDKETLALILGLASLAVGVVGVAATLFVQGRRREQKARAHTGGVAVGGNQHVGGSVVPGAGAVVGDRGGTALNITVQSGATMNVYLDGLPQAKGEVHDQFEQGRQLQNVDQHEAAIREFEKAFATAKDNSQRSALHILIGNSFLLLSRLEEADGHYRQALGLAERAGDQEAQGAALGNLGLVHADRGQLRKAEDCHARALSIHRRIGSEAGQAADLGNLGNVYVQSGNLSSAEKHYHQALSIQEQVGNRTGEGGQFVNLANVCVRLGELDAAEEYLKRALAIHDETGSRRGRALDLANLGIVQFLREDLDGGEEYFTQALAINRELGDRLGEASAIAKLGLLAMVRLDLDGARDLLGQAEALYRAVGAGGEGPEAVRAALELLEGTTPAAPKAKGEPVRKRPRKKP